VITNLQFCHQVANYGIGGVYNHHTDAAGEFSDRRTEPEGHGDRVATFMGYLSDVTAGGATVFPSVGITSFPKRGSLNKLVFEKTSLLGLKLIKTDTGEKQLNYMSSNMLKYFQLS